MTTVILAEKPKQAGSYAKAFSSSERRQGYFAVSDPILPEDTVITYGFGHLVELAMPAYYPEYKEKGTKMSLAHLPIYPESFHYEVREDSSDQFYIVKGLLEKADTIVIATDCDREGENIAWSIMKKAKIDFKNKVLKRLWINSLEKSVIRQGFQNLKDDHDYYKYYLEAEARKKSDWLVGMNLTELYSVLLRQKGLDKILSVGRVQTPTLYMIYQRDQMIKNFKVSTYYELEAEILADDKKFDAKLTPSQQFQDKTSLITFRRDNRLENGQETGIIKSVQKEEKSIASPRLFSLSSLQSEANKRFKASASDTLAAVQNLYEAGLLSYPRTSCNYITEEEFSYLKENVKKYGDLIDNTLKFTRLESNKRYVDGSRVQEHYAIIPTNQVASQKQFTEFSDLEKKIYWLVVATTISMFLPTYKYSETTVTTDVGNVSFASSGKTLVDIGWKKLFGLKQNKNDLPELREGQQVSVTPRVVEKQTTPPKPFTEGTLITAMKTAGRELNDKKAQAILKDVKGIGTEATRANIIDGLKEKDYVVSQKNALHVTELGELLCRSVESSQLLTSVEMTAKWEEKLKEISQKTYSQEEFLIQIRNFISSLIAQVPTYIESNTKLDEMVQAVLAQRSLGTCPKCHQGQVLDKGKFYGCSEYSNGCNFLLPKKYLGRKLAKNELIELLQNKQTKLLTGFVGKESGKEYSAYLKLNDDCDLELEFPKHESNSIGLCPKCRQGQIMDRGKFYGCDRYSKDGEGCDFSFSKIIAGHEITSEEAKQIIEGEKTALLQGFVSKKGKTFSARLKLDDEHNIAFEFEKKKSKKKWRNK